MPNLDTIRTHLGIRIYSCVFEVCPKVDVLVSQLGC